MAKIPITIITGFLGSGKTTLLQEVLKYQQDTHIAVIVNELGQAGLDQKILNQTIAYTPEKMLLLNGGCTCCNRREDLIVALKNLLQTYQNTQTPLQHIIIETTGIANPAPILFTILTDSFLCHHFTTHCVITCLDSVNGMEHIHNNPEAQSQIISSDLLILTKTDLQSNINPLKQAVLTLNPAITLLDKQEFCPKDFLNFLNQHSKHTPNHLPQDTLHTSNINTLSLYFKKPIDWSVFGIWLSMLLHKHGSNILRVKGILDIGEEYLVNINGVLHIIHPPTHIFYNKNIAKRSEIVFITKDLPPQSILDSLTTFASLLGDKAEIEVV